MTTDSVLREDEINLERLNITFKGRDESVGVKTIPLEDIFIMRASWFGKRGTTFAVCFIFIFVFFITFSNI